VWHTPCFYFHILSVTKFDLNTTSVTSQNWKTKTPGANRLPLWYFDSWSFSLIYHFMTHHKIQREDTCHAFNPKFPGSPTHPLFVLSPTQIVMTRQLPFTISFHEFPPTHYLYYLPLKYLWFAWKMLKLETRVSFKDFVMQMVAIIEKVI